MTPPPPDTPETNVDELRQRLRTLGYLDAGVDRFVLAPAHGRRGAAAIAFGASTRIGILGGLLLGPAAAAGVTLQLPGLVTNVRDGAIVALYLAVLSAAAIAAATLFVGLIIAVAARRLAASLNRWGRPVAIAAGLVVASASLGYLTLLWLALRSAGAGLHSAAWSLAGLTVAVIVSLLLGHAVTLTALALIVAGTGSPMRTPGVPGTSWRALLTAGTVLFVAALAIANVSGIGRTDQGPAIPHLTVVPTGLRVHVIAIDGFDDRIYEGLSAAGRLPALTKAFSGARATLTVDDISRADAALTQIDPARLWTTTATGQPSARHGVRTLETRRVAGVTGILQADSTLGRLLGASTDLLRLTQPSIVSGIDRRERTFWEVAAGAGLRTAVVNWWATWPATSDDGVIVSDRATLRLERGGPLDAEVAPAALYDRLAQRWPTLRSHASDLATQVLAGAGVNRDFSVVLQRSAELDAMMLLLAGEVDGPAMDLTAVYLPGLDIAQHALGGDEGFAATSPGRVAAMESYYVALDALLAEATGASLQDLVIIVTAPGRVMGDRTGGLVIDGPGIRRNAIVNGKTTDVAPTLLYALGVPISDQLAGRPLLDLFEPAFVTRHEVRQVTTYGPPSRKAREITGRALDDEAIERLRSLGYVR